jgi:hypothetical protein
VELVLWERIVGAIELHGVEVVGEDETHAAGARWTVPSSPQHNERRAVERGAPCRARGDFAVCVAHVGRPRIS